MSHELTFLDLLYCREAIAVSKAMLEEKRRMFAVTGDWREEDELELAALAKLLETLRRATS